LALSKLDYAFLAAVALFYLLFGLDAYGLLDNNEGLYAEIAREALERRSFAIPHLDGVPYLEKPPLLGWLLAAAYAAFGQSELVSRLVPVSAALLLTGALVAFGRSLRRPFTGWLAALILASSCVFALLSRTVFPDLLLTALFSSAMMLFYSWHRRGERSLLVASYCCIGFAVLAKGFLALVLAAAIFPTFGALCARSWNIRRLLDPPAVAALLLVLLPWHVALALEDREFAWFYFVNEHVLRYLDLREPKDYYTGPVWYYLPRMLAYVFPWSAFIALLPVKRGGAADEPADLERFLWTWFGAVLVFFSLSQAKANYYMVLGMPPLALLLAARIEMLASERRRTPLVLCALAVAVAAACGLAVVRYGLWTPRTHGLWWFVLRRRDELTACFSVFAAVGGIAAALFAARRDQAAICAMALAGVPLLMFFVSTAERADRYVSARAVARYVQTRYPDTQVLLYQDYERLSSLSFYLQREIAVVDSRSNDLLFGMRHSRDAEKFPSAESVLALAPTRPTLILVHRIRADDFRRKFGSAFVPAGRVGDVIVFESRAGVS
jgi:4-amino-4-deoxy-L-arabinose transferase-like glycosyltransferase